MTRFRTRRPIQPPKKRRDGLWIGLAIGIVVVIAVLAVWADLEYLGGTVTVTGIEFTSTDHVCGVTGGNLSGFSTNTGGSLHESVTFPDENSTSCTVSSITANTSGFSISAANTPLTIPLGGSRGLVFTIDVPKSSYTGPLSIDLE